MTGAELREWRQTWGMSVKEVGARVHYTDCAIRMVELGYRAVAPDIVQYVQAHPPPPEDPTYPPTVAGFTAALTTLGLTRHSWARWFGRWGPMAAWHWVRGNAPLPIQVTAWLRAGAPRSGPLVLPPPMPGLTIRVPPSRALPRRLPHPGEGWLWLRGRGWAPPAAVCAPGESYGTLTACPRCAWRQDCWAMTYTAGRRAVAG